MFQDNAYEPLAEVYIHLQEDSCEDECIYCLCSRIVLTTNEIEEEELKTDFLDAQQNTEEGSTVKFFNTSTESSQPTTVQSTKKRELDEGVSCYWSASHCSTDDSTRGEAPHSDSGADLSETSHFHSPGWDQFWSEHGDRLVWQSWIQKYGEYVDLSYSNEETLASQAICIAESLVEVIGGGENTRLSICSEISDSLTNITPLTEPISELSTEESSLLSSSDSVSSGGGAHESQWQALWTDHFNRQYRLAYQRYIVGGCLSLDHQQVALLPEEQEVLEGYSGPADIESTSTEPTVIEEEIGRTTFFANSKVSSVRALNELFNDESAIGEDTEEECEDGVLERSAHDPRRSKSKKAKYNHIDRGAQSVGYLLQSLRTLTVEQDSEVDCARMEPGRSESPPGECSSSRRMRTRKDAAEQISSQPSSSEVDCTQLQRHSLKRSFHKRNEKQDKNQFLKAMAIMGYCTKGELNRARSEVVYKKKNIRWQNRSLNMRSHIRFDEDGNLSSQEKVFLKYSDDSDTNEKTNIASEEIKSDFSEKDDDSSNGDFFSAGEQFDSPAGDSKKIEKEKKKKKIKRRGLPKEIQKNERLLKFWKQRYSLFSKFDEGIKLDQESWYSVTPERIASYTALRCKCDVIIDAFCGAGGNTIQFAMECERVIGIDIDPAKIQLARNNAQVYGVDDRIEWIVGDFTQLYRGLSADVVFLSPPWGGLDYSSQPLYDLDNILPPLGARGLFHIASSITPNLAFFLPRNVNMDQLIQLARQPGEEWTPSIEVEQNFLQKRFVALTAYFGELVNQV